MILRLKNNVNASELAQLAEKFKAFGINYKEGQFLITSSSVKEVPNGLENLVIFHYKVFRLYYFLIYFS